jgi:hypothetical protein
MEKLFCREEHRKSTALIFLVGGGRIFFSIHTILYSGNLWQTAKKCFSYFAKAHRQNMYRMKLQLSADA